MSLPVGIYLHWPFCRQLCSYCNFNKYLPSKSPGNELMISAFVKELRNQWASLYQPEQKTIRSIYFGGGTPSLAPVQFFEAVLKEISKLGHVAPEVEITIEANPSSTDSRSFSDFKSLGVNRLSLGIQSLRDPQLKLLSRDHTVKDSLKSIEISRSLFPKRTSLDMIWGLPNQTLADWTEDFDRLLKLADTHVSAYQLTIERGTPMYKIWKMNNQNFPDDHTAADFFQLTTEIANRNGFDHYEVSSFSRRVLPGEKEGQARSLHNDGYWKGHDYLGVGPGAHSRFSVGPNTRERRIQILEPKRWAEEVNVHGEGSKTKKTLTSQESHQELIVLGLRLRAGVSHQDFLRHSNGVSLSSSLDLEAVKQLSLEGFVEFDDVGLRTTAKGFLVMDEIVQRILLHTSI